MDILRPWFALKGVPGVGNLLFRRLVEHFGSPDAVLAAGETELMAVQGVNARLAAAICQHRPSDDIDRELAAVQHKGYDLVTLTDRRYPVLLRRIPDPPPVLYIYGELPDSALNIAVVGSRNATGYGIATTRRLCLDLAARQVTIVSGMARGVDTAAHSGAIAGGGKTIAVLGTGLNRIYPRENRQLFHQIAENGAVVSEFSLGSGPDAHHFPARNRIISGMCHGTVVVEATGRSGSLITARLAAEQNREGFRCARQCPLLQKRRHPQPDQTGCQAGGSRRGCAGRIRAHAADRPTDGFAGAIENAGIDERGGRDYGYIGSRTRSHR